VQVLGLLLIKGVLHRRREPPRMLVLFATFYFDILARWLATFEKTCHCRLLRFEAEFARTLLLSQKMVVANRRA
jgi:hypothetical protein